MDKSLFRYVWRHSRRDQLIVCAVVIASLPFYFASLDLPRQIVNEAIQGRSFENGRQTARFLDLSFDWPQWLGGGQVVLFEGVEVGRIGLLLGLSLVFLFFVLVNGAFKYWINVQKGALGERMLRRMRFDLFSMVLRFTPDALRRVKSSETATIIKDEVEPIGGFIGDAFITPVFLGLQALTALAFILIQNVWLGLMAVAVIGVQFVIIPRLRRELLRLGRERQLASRRLAGRIGEVMDGMEAVQVHNASRWERTEIGHRLFQLFDLRFKIYRRKFMVKYLNNLLAQLTPFLFYAVGGYFAIMGRLDIGQLVAVIGAYRELPPPLKELIDWDQQRLDVQVKYDQVVEHFSPERLLPIEETAEAADETPLSGALEAEGLAVQDPHGGSLIASATFAVALPARVALVSDGSASAGQFAKIIARRVGGYEGRLSIGGRDLAQLPGMTVGRRIAYAGVDPILFPGSIRDNLVYGLRHRPLATEEAEDREARRRLTEALRTGNPIESIADPWIDYALAGARDEEDLDRILLDRMRRFGLGEDLYRFGLSGMIDPEKNPDLAERLLKARERLRETFRAEGMAELVEPFDPQRFNTQATIAENLLFGVPVRDEFAGRRLAEHPGVREALERQGLTDDLLAMGLRIAETMTEIFRGLPPGHPLFDQFSFIGADELPAFEAIVRRQANRGGLNRDQRLRLLSVPLAYVEPRHRLGLLHDALREKIVAARSALRALLELDAEPGVAFYDAGRFCPAAPLKDNLLFGRVSYLAANAQGRVAEAVSAVVEELGLREAIERIGLDHRVGPAGRLISAQQRAVVNLVRCLVKRPDLLVVDGALAPFDETRAGQMLALLLDMNRERSLFFVLPNDRQAKGFDIVLRFSQGRIAVEETPGAPVNGAGRALEEEVAGGMA